MTCTREASTPFLRTRSPIASPRTTTASARRSVHRDNGIEGSCRQRPRPQDAELDGQLRVDILEPVHEQGSATIPLALSPKPAEVSKGEPAPLPLALSLSKGEPLSAHHRPERRHQRRRGHRHHGVIASARAASGWPPPHRRSRSRAACAPCWPCRASCTEPARSVIPRWISEDGSRPPPRYEPRAASAVTSNPSRTRSSARSVASCAVAERSGWKNWLRRRTFICLRTDHPLLHLPRGHTHVNSIGLRVTGEHRSPRRGPHAKPAASRESSERTAAQAPSSITTSLTIRSKVVRDQSWLPVSIITPWERHAFEPMVTRTSESIHTPSPIHE